MEIETPDVQIDMTFPFTNYTDKDFTAKWDGQEYTLPALSTVKMIGMIPTASPEEIQSIRKKFANDLAVAVFYQSKDYKPFDVTPEQSREGKIGMLYTEKDIAPFIQRCLEPLPVAHAEVKETIKKTLETSVDEKGKPISRVLEGSESLVGESQRA